jgi:hypothetical protein
VRRLEKRGCYEVAVIVSEAIPQLRKGSSWIAAEALQPGDDG